jgi:glycosyltransferase involved in cell wall biosynthesis
MRILFLSRWFPFPHDNGAKVRVFNIIKAIAKKHEVRLISFTSEPVSDERLAHMRQFCYQVDAVPYRTFQARSLKARLGFLSPIPRSFLDTDNPEFHALVEKAGQEEKFDLVLGSQWDTIPYMLGASSLKATPKLLEEVEISIYRDQYLCEASPMARLRKGMMWNKWRYFMAQSLRQINACTVVSEPEIAPIQACLPGFAPIGVIPNGADIERFTGDFGQPQPNTVIYTGAMTYYVNFDAMKFFLGEVWPKVLAQVPDAKLYMCGRTDGVAVHELPQYNSAILVGHVADIRPRIAQSWVSVVPERVGGGTRIKVPESMALGTPVVATTRGATGLDLKHGHDILVADKPEAFAQELIRVLKDSALREALSRNGRAAVQAKYDWRVIGQQLDDFMVRVIQAGSTN